MLHDWSLIILAAGKGTRMGGDTPKPLVKLNGKPLISPIIELAKEMQFAQTVIVISDYTEQIQREFNQPALTYCKVEPLGTGYCTQEALKLITTPYVIIAQADDSYFYTSTTLRNLIDRHTALQAKFTLAAAYVTREAKYASVSFTPEGLLLQVHKTVEDLQQAPPKYVVSGLYAAEKAWLVSCLAQVKVNTKGEIGLPSVIDLGQAEGAVLGVAPIAEDEWFGVNTHEELRLAEQRLRPS